MLKTAAFLLTLPLLALAADSKPAGTLITANQGDNTLSFINLATGNVAATVQEEGRVLRVRPCRASPRSQPERAQRCTSSSEGVQQARNRQVLFHKFRASWHSKCPAEAGQRCQVPQHYPQVAQQYVSRMPCSGRRTQ